MLFLSENVYLGYGQRPMHLSYKCETDDKNRRESSAETKFRKVLSFLLFISDILVASQQSDILVASQQSDIEALRLQ